jgi:hypothetical protein
VGGGGGGGVWVGGGGGEHKREKGRIRKGRWNKAGEGMGRGVGTRIPPA